MKRIIFLNRYFFPDHSATSQILSDLAFHLAGIGHDVRVVTGRQLYDDPQAELPESEIVAGVRVRRVATTRFGRAAIIGRAMDYASFYPAAWREVLTSAEPGDILVAMTDPPLLCLPALSAARRRRLRLVNWLQDLYPEVAMRLGVKLATGPVGAALQRRRDAALREAAANVVVGEGMASIVRHRGIAPERTHVIANWCDDEDIRPVARNKNRLRADWGFGDRFVIGYSGNLGRSHEYETLLDAALALRGDPRFVFLLIGGGSGFDALARRVRDLGLEGQFRFLPYQERGQLKFSLGAADVHWLSLRPELEGLIVPSKFYGIAAAGRPVIAITASDGEIARLVREHGCGVVIAPGDGTALAAAVCRIADNSQEAAAMGQRARALIEARFTRTQAFARWETLLASIG